MEPPLFPPCFCPPPQLPQSSCSHPRVKHQNVKGTSASPKGLTFQALSGALPPPGPRPRDLPGTPQSLTLLFLVNNLAEWRSPADSSASVWCVGSLSHLSSCASTETSRAGSLMGLRECGWGRRCKIFFFHPWIISKYLPQSPSQNLEAVAQDRKEVWGNSSSQCL